MIDYRHTDSGQTNTLEFSAHMIKSEDEKIGKYNTTMSRNGHRFMPIILDKFVNVLQGTKDMLYQMFLRKFFNGKHDITEAEASFVATKKFVFWLKHIASAMAKTKAMCTINRSTKLISIQYEKKHDKGSKNSSSYFDSRIDIEQESDVLIADYSFDVSMNATTSKKMMIYVLKYPDAQCTLPVLFSMQYFIKITKYQKK